MKKLIFNNTLQSGHITNLIYREGNSFTGVCLEFDLVVSGKTSKEAEELIEDYTRAWLENVQKNKLSEELLNRPAPMKYWQLYKQTLAEAFNKLKVQENPSKTFKLSPPPVESRSFPYNSNYCFN